MQSGGHYKPNPHEALIRGGDSNRGLHNYVEKQRKKSLNQQIISTLNWHLKQSTIKTETKLTPRGVKITPMYF